jgi:predicted flap endonuclease-1-like 5' DNA nuclease
MMAKNTPQATDAPASDLPHGIGNPARSALAVIGITQLEQLTGMSEKEVLKLHGVGPKAVRILKEELSKRSLAFAGPEIANKLREQSNRRMPE